MATDVNISDKFESIKINEGEDLFEKCIKTNLTSIPDEINEYFKLFDKDRDGVLNQDEFSQMLKKLFVKNGHPYSLSPKQVQDIFKLLDENKDGVLDFQEFEICWYHWFKQILDPVSVLIIVDVQNDFISGTLAIKDCPAGQDGEAVVPIINKVMEDAPFNLVVYSLDWHPPNHVSFIENVHLRKMHNSSRVSADSAKTLDTVVFDGPNITEQILWPSHCVQNTWGSKLHPDLKIVKNAVYINKGTNPDIDSYSAFWDNKKLSQTGLVKELTKRKVTDVYVCGLAYDVCVGATATHSVEHGFRTILIEDGSRGVHLEDIEQTRERLRKKGILVVESSEVPGMVNATDRNPELGYQAAVNVAMARRLVKESEKK